MTNGTLDHLEKIAENHPEINLYFMRNQTAAVAYYEDNGPPVFDEPRGYEIFVTKGTLQLKGYVVMQHIPVSDDGKPIFESEYQDQADKIKAQPGVYALRVLRPLRGNTYVVFIQWENEARYQSWFKADMLKNTFGKKKKKKKKPKYRAGKPFSTKYTMVDWDEVYQERIEEQNQTELDEEENNDDI